MTTVLKHGLLALAIRLINYDSSELAEMEWRSVGGGSG